MHEPKNSHAGARYSAGAARGKYARRVAMRRALARRGPAGVRAIERRVRWEIREFWEFQGPVWVAAWAVLISALCGLVLLAGAV